MSTVAKEELKYEHSSDSMSPQVKKETNIITSGVERMELPELTSPKKDDKVDTDGEKEDSRQNKILSMRDGKQCLVKLSLVLHITNPSRDTLLKTPKYTGQVLTVLTSSRHHPKYGVKQEITDVRLTYDSVGHLVILEVPYIEEGIYRIVFTADATPHPVFAGSTIHETQFIWTQSIDDVVPPDARFIIIGDLCQVPVPNKNQSNREKCQLQSKLLEYLHTTNFSKFTLPLLLGYGEPNLWSDIKSCDDVSPVFLFDKSDYERWKWLDNVRIPNMKKTVNSKDTCAEEPSVIPDDVPFCHYIYRTYIAGVNQRVVPPNVPQVGNNKPVNDADICESSEDTESEEEQAPKRGKTPRTPDENRRINRKIRRRRRHIYSKRRKYRFALDVNSLCRASAKGKEKKSVEKCK